MATLATANNNSALQLQHQHQQQHQQHQQHRSSALSLSANDTSVDETLTPLTTSPFPRQLNNDANDVLHCVATRSRRNLGHEFENGAGSAAAANEVHHAQLIQIVNRQRGKLDEQQQRLVRLEDELIVSEANLDHLQQRERDQALQLAQELAHLQDACQQHDLELMNVCDIQEEWNSQCQQEEQLRTELARFQTQMASVDAQLEHCQPTIRKLNVEIEREEQRLVDEMESELVRIKTQLEAAEREGEAATIDVNELRIQLDDSEEVIQRIKQDMELLTQEIKEANLQSLSIAPADDLKVLLEGNYKTGHGRRMLGSPRQLENAVPTNKNPHGVWV